MFLEDMEIKEIVDGLLYRIIENIMIDSKFYYTRIDFLECLELIYDFLDQYDIGYTNEKNIRIVWDKYFDEVENQ